MNISVLNPEPTTIKLENLIPELLAAKLRAICSNEGTEADYHGCDNTLEYRIPNIYTGRLSKATLEVLPDLHTLSISLMPYINDAFKHTCLLQATTNAGYWLMEYGIGGCFSEHVDYSTGDDAMSTPAIATLVVNLSPDDNYTGGQLYVADKPVKIEYLDGMIWDGWTYHKTDPVKSGTRNILVIHFTGFVKI